MKCQDVRSAIDLASHREPMSSTANIHLTGCSSCHRYADETKALLQLIKAQPEIEVPADFDFKLRARIARANSERQRPAAFLERLWARSFSWTEVTAVMATVTLAVTLTTFHFIQTEQPGADPNLPSLANPADLANLPAPSAPVAMAEVPAAAASVANRAAVKPMVVRSGSRVARMAVSGEKTAPLATNKLEIAATEVPKVKGENLWRGYNPARGQFISAPNGYLYGAEGSNLRSAPMVAVSF
ncbi:MAG TPA: hypothetical protein VJ302_05110 [Blastocatellia bacterium]|nr:hypothetical protein [Blastocatellia bacterium]